MSDEMEKVGQSWIVGLLGEKVVHFAEGNRGS